jgi:hypothetical protein
MEQRGIVVYLAPKGSQHGRFMRILWLLWGTMQWEPVRSEKMMLTNVWNPSGFHVINVLSKGIKFNADH